MIGWLGVLGNAAFPGDWMDDRDEESGTGGIGAITGFDDEFLRDEAAWPNAASMSDAADSSMSSNEGDRAVALGTSALTSSSSSLFFGRPRLLLTASFFLLFFAIAFFCSHVKRATAISLYASTSSSGARP